MWALKMLYNALQDKRKTVEGARSTFMSAMSDAGLKPTVVYHNLTPAELYEKVRRETLLQDHRAPDL
jgi:hypothetical protein